MANRSYPSLLLHLELGQPNTGLLRAAAEIAAQFESRVVGMVLCQPLPVGYGEGYVDFELIEQNRKDIAREVSETQVQFRAALTAQALALEWRSAVLGTSLVDELAAEARTADLILSTQPSGDSVDASRHVSPGELVLQAGRPVLLVPRALSRMRLQHVLVAWQDTRESRRAVADSLPLLQWAGQVSVVEIAPDGGLKAARTRVSDVASWLLAHGVLADPVAVATEGDATATQLKNIAQELRAELIVAGAYGHSRLRQWALGGVTRDLLMQAECCTLLSH